MHPFVEAARPRTLPAAVAPVLVGSAAAERAVPDLDLVRAGLALVVALSLQVAVNYANDYFDGVRGVDTEARTGPRRAVASGLVTPAAMRSALVAALAVAAVTGITLAWLAGWELLLIGAVAIAAAIGYSGGRRPYASRGLGELSVFVFFGLVATAGSAYVQDERLTLLPVVAAVPVGLVAVALLVVNNLRDIPTDRAAGKITLAVRLGEPRTRLLFPALLVGSAAWVLPLAVLTGSPWPLLGAVALPFGFPAIRLVGTAPLGPELIVALELTGRYQLLLGLAIAVGLTGADLAAGA